MIPACKTFGIELLYEQTKSTQYLPKLFINSSIIPTAEIGESFKYLGRFFYLNMVDKDHKSELISLIDKLMSNIDLKPLHPKDKLLLYNCYVLSKISWHFTVALLSKTWVTEPIDSVIGKYIRKMARNTNKWNIE